MLDEASDGVLGHAVVAPIGNPYLGRPGRHDDDIPSSLLKVRDAVAIHANSKVVRKAGDG